MKKARLYHYALKMDSKVILREQRLKQREGLVVELTLNGKRALGEIAPLAGFSHETLEQAAVQAQAALMAWVKDEKLKLDELYPSVACGLSFALYELDGALPTQGLYQLAPLCSGDPDQVLEKIACQQGEKIAKVKVGLYEPIRDGILVNMLLEAIPELTLRLDANQQWTKEKALQFSRYIAPEYRSRIAFIEEPCQTMCESLAFAEQTGIAIAWDETIREPNFHLQAEKGLAAIVIKPSLVGSIEKASALVQQAQQLGLKAVISSSLESSLGLNHLARLAQQLTPHSKPGLDTLELFAEQLEQPWPDSSLPLRHLVDSDLIWQNE